VTPIGMQRVVGLDTSLTATGIGIITRRINGTCIANTSVITSTGHLKDTIPQRAHRLLTLSQQILHAVAGAELVVIEGPYSGTKGGSPLDRFGLWWQLVIALAVSDIPVAVCPPKSRSKLATGDGNAGKAAVSHYVARLWPDWEPTGSKRTTDNEADSLVLAHAGAVWLEWEVSTLQRHRDALDGIAWPDRPVGDLEVPA
jgi:Holliday junction resolvasome RuvABC endonuclease subunit